VRLGAEVELMRIATLLDTLSCRHLTRDESRAAFERLVEGMYSELEITALIAALKARGESPEEIAGAAMALRESALPFPRPSYPFADTCGTGGDGAGSFNISTAVALVAAELGIPVAKHGNRSVSSRCGSADVLETAGVRLDASPEDARRALDEIGICFLFAPAYHAGVRHASPVRKALGTRTIFNLLGPLANPSRPPYQLMGVYDPSLCVPLATTLGMLGAEAALVVHGSGLDEVALHGPTAGALWRDGRVAELEITPEAAGLSRRPLSELDGGTPGANLDLLVQVLEGNGSAARCDAVALNAGTLAWVTGRAVTLARGVAHARDALAGGGAARRLERWVELSHGA
jgi:anthranilate phosphoribosyltransferase